MQSSSLQIQVRRGILADAVWIAALCHKQFQFAHDGGLTPEDMLYYVDKTFTSDQVKKDMSFLGNHYLVIETDKGESLGCIKLGPVHLKMAKSIEGAIELTRLYLVPAAIGKGIGSILLKEGLTLAQELEYTSMWLHVYQKNPQAIAFYEKWGFEKVGIQDFPVRNSCPVGWVMKCEL